jgi:protein required for attachment to host cells
LFSEVNAMMQSTNRLSVGPTWVVVADASRADIFLRHKRHSPLEAVQCLTDSEARSKEQDLVADGPGRTFDSAGKGRHAMEPDHTEKEHLRQTFAHRVAHVLESARQADRFKHLVIVAGPAMLGELRAQLDAATAKLVLAEFNKELTGHAPEAIAKLIDAQS